MITSKKRENTDSLYKKGGGGGKKPKVKRARLDKRAAATVKDENYIPYTASDQHTEDGLAINSFEQQAKNAEFSITNQPDEQVPFRPGQKKWDRIKKKMVPMQDPRNGKIRTESGVWIPATYKTNRYADWKEKTKIEEQVHRELGDDGAAAQQGPKYPETRWGRHMANQEMKKRIGGAGSGADRELLKPEQIVRQRMRLEHIKRKENANKIKKAANRKKHVKRVKSKSKSARK